MQQGLTLQEVLGVLSKSSPYAVATERDEAISVELDRVKKYLYIADTGVEKEFEKAIAALAPSDKKIIFLCGSSGDGKSEILTKAKKKYEDKVEFHLDATHSLKPDATAIETLDELFDDFHNANKSLVVGINIGMMGNYAKTNKHPSITDSIGLFLGKKETPDNHIFINFEDFPKFTLNTDSHSSEFALKLIQRIVAKDDNVIRNYFEQDTSKTKISNRIKANYRLLSIPSVQTVIIDSLFKARLLKDQFVTARALLDFIYHLLVGSKYLFENLFSCTESELAQKVADFDPSLLRTKKIDEFILFFGLNIEDLKFLEFKNDLNKELDLVVDNDVNAEFYIRLFFVLKDFDFSNNYHKKYKSEFNDNTLDSYATLWRLHNVKLGGEQISNLLSFYEQIIIASLTTYNNKNAYKLSNREFLLSHTNGIDIVAELDIKADLDAIQSCSGLENKDISVFRTKILVGEKPIEILVNINLLAMMHKILKGHRPNKHDKNAIVILDEVIEKLNVIANQSPVLFFHKGAKKYRIEDVAKGTHINVSGG